MFAWVAHFGALREATGVGCQGARPRGQKVRILEPRRGVEYRSPAIEGSNPMGP
jgi:hypothetical protein